MYITAQGPRLRNDLYCVEWDVKLYCTIPYRQPTDLRLSVVVVVPLLIAVVVLVVVVVFAAAAAAAVDAGDDEDDEDVVDVQL